MPGFGRPADRVLVGPATSDDAGVYLHGDTPLVATVDYITPVCDDPRRFGRVAAANSLSDVFAMGGRPLFALNICCFPEQVPREALTGILEGGLDALGEAGAALLGGHTVQDRELKFGLAVVGEADRERLLPVGAARPGDRLVLTKPLGTGAVINAFRRDKLDEQALEPVLVEMERLNAEASRLALSHGARACTDITGFGLVGHALNMARGSGGELRIEFDRLPVFDAFWSAVAGGVSTRATRVNRAAAEGRAVLRAGLSDAQDELLFDPQTSGGLLVALGADRAGDLVDNLRQRGHRAAAIGEVVRGPARVTVV